MQAGKFTNGIQLRELRQSDPLRIPQYVIYKNMGIPQGLVTAWENGNTKMTEDEIAGYLEVVHKCEAGKISYTKMKKRYSLSFFVREEEDPQAPAQPVQQAPGQVRRKRVHALHRQTA